MHVNIFSLTCRYQKIPKVFRLPVDLPHVYIGVRPRYISRVGFPQCASSSSTTCIRQYSHQGFPGMARLLYLLIIAGFPVVFASVTEMTDKIVKVLCF